MARLTATNFSGALQFPYATAGPDLFLKEDVQVLAQAVDQHDHSSGKGLGVSGLGIKTAIDMPDWFRSTGRTSPVPTTGSGLEMYYETGTNEACLISYNRGASVFRNLKLDAARLAFQINDIEKLAIDTNGVQAGSTIYANAAVGIQFPSGSQIGEYVGGSDHRVSMTALTVTPGKTATAQLDCNGPLTVAGGAATILSGAVSCQSNLAVGGTTGLTGDLSMGASARIIFPTGGVISDAGSAYVALNKASIQTLAVGSVGGNIACTGHYLGQGIVQAGAIGNAAAGTIALTNGIGQGNGAAATMPLVKGSGFGPSSTAGVGWIMFNTGGTNIYVPYYV